MPGGGRWPFFLAKCFAFCKNIGVKSSILWLSSDKTLVLLIFCVFLFTEPAVSYIRPLSILAKQLGWDFSKLSRGCQCCPISINFNRNWGSKSVRQLWKTKKSQRMCCIQGPLLESCLIRSKSDLCLGKFFRFCHLARWGCIFETKYYNKEDKYWQKIFGLVEFCP